MSVEAFSVQLVGQLGTSHEVIGCPHSIISCLGCIRILTRHVRYHLLPTVPLLRFDLVALVHTSSQERSRRRRHWHSTPTRRRRHFPACPAPADVTLPARRRDGGAPRVGGATALLVRRQSASLPPARRRRHPPAFSRWQRGSYSPACQAVAGVPSPAQARQRLHYPAAGRHCPHLSGGGLRRLRRRRTPPPSRRQRHFPAGSAVIFLPPHGFGYSTDSRTFGLVERPSWLS